MRYPNRISAKYYGAAAKDVAEVLSSTSGGIASVFAREMVAGGGVVFGAAFDPFPIVRHVRVENNEGITRLKGSKYVESDIKDALRQVGELLKKDKKVLFIGLPCQVAALYGVLGGDDENLITVDLICHGKPPQKLFTTWVEELEGRLNAKIVNYWFRNKFNCRWDDRKTYLHYFQLDDGHILSVPMEDNWYARYFLGGISFMDGCYRCLFAKIPRIADVTIGDCWGASSDDRLVAYASIGVSFVSVQSKKGENLIEECKDAVRLFEISPNFALSSCHHLTHRTERSLYRPFVVCYVYLPEWIRKFCDFILFGCGSMVKNLMRRVG